MGLEGGPIRWGISIPQYVVDGTFEPAVLRAYLGRAEALGFESAWTLEQVMGTRPHLGPIEIIVSRRRAPNGCGSVVRCSSVRCTVRFTWPRASLRSIS